MTHEGVNIKPTFWYNKSNSISQNLICILMKIVFSKYHLIDFDFKRCLFQWLFQNPLGLSQISYCLRNLVSHFQRNIIILWTNVLNLLMIATISAEKSSRNFFPILQLFCNIYKTSEVKCGDNRVHVFTPELGMFHRDPSICNCVTCK